MVDLIKFLAIFIITFIMFFPLIPLALKTKKRTNSAGLRYVFPDNKKNFGFVIILLIEIVILALLFKVFFSLTETITNIPFISKFFSDIEASTSGRGDFVFFVILTVILNIVVLYSYLALKALFKKKIFDPAYNISDKIKKQKDEKKKEEEAETGVTADENSVENEENEKKKGRISVFKHFAIKSIKKEVEKEQKKEEEVPNFLVRLFFDPDTNYQYAKGWAQRVEIILQRFVYIVEIVYLVLFFALLVMLFFPAEDAVFDFLVNGLKLRDWYVYPFLSLFLLQEICNTLHTKPVVGEKKTDEKKSEVEEETPDQVRLRALQAELSKRFDGNHKLRFYPTVAQRSSEDIDLLHTNRTYASALKFIKNYMTSISHKVAKSYMESLDAMYAGNDVYFAASFYSEFGEYIVAYTYTRLLAGSRMIFIIPEKDKKEALCNYITERLNGLAGTNGNCGWRIHLSGERLDQADILILSPEDFKDDNIVEHYPTFFEEASNAIFIDVDRMVSLKSYLCTIMAMRLQKITENRIKFIFLTKDFIKGFAASSLPKFFCLEKVLSFSSAKENEDVSYMLWNKESKRNRVYNKNGQTLSELECLIAEVASSYKVDGVRIVSSAPIDHASKKTLATRDIEINNFFKAAPDINYMIYDDDRCNLAASVYACTRFRGKKHSIVNIISRPYLLREFFMSKIMTEDYINRSSFIQPRVSEHVDNQRLTLLKLFCDVTNSLGMTVGEFEDKVREIILVSFDKRNPPLCDFCEKMVQELIDTEEVSEEFDVQEGQTAKKSIRRVINKIKLQNLKYPKLAAYLVAGLCDDQNTSEKNSIGNKARDYYLIVDASRQDGYTLTKEKNITFKRVKEVFDKLLQANECVKLVLNDRIIGALETFPNRVPLEYIVGQNIVYDNTEYEIERISEDCKTIYLRYENVIFQSCVDTVFLRRYDIVDFGEYVHKEYEEDVLRNSNGNIREIKVESFSGKVIGETYGYYNMMSNHQTLDFVNGVLGNPNIREEFVAQNARHLDNCKMLRVSLMTTMECNDRMRLLMAAVFNEFIKTMFPYAYRCIAICPVLERPVSVQDAVDFDGKVKTLYPYIKSGVESETCKNRMQFIFINDCLEDVGVLNWFDDPFGNYMEEFLANVYSYLHWLSLRIEENKQDETEISGVKYKRKKQQQYIFFGGEDLPKVYDLDGCCLLFNGYNRILSEEGKKDYETAGYEEEIEIKECCSFCHRPLESGRFSYFIDSNDGRYICSDCQTSVICDNESLEKLNDDVCDYLEKKYPEIMWKFSKATLVPVGNMKKRFSDIAFELDTDNTIKIEQDIPRRVVALSLLCAQIEVWQLQNGVLNSYAYAQDAFECSLLLRSTEDILIGDEVEDYINWFETTLDDGIKSGMHEISDFVNHDDGDKNDGEPNANENDSNDSEGVGDDNNSSDDHDDQIDGQEVDEEGTEVTEEEQEEKEPSIYDNFNGKRTSFEFIRLKQIELNDEEMGDNGDGSGDYSDNLYDPNKTPRFWKRYLLGLKLSEIDDEIASDEDDNTDDNVKDDENDLEVKDSEGDYMGDDESEDENTNDESGEVNDDEEPDDENSKDEPNEVDADDQPEEENADDLDEAAITSDEEPNEDDTGNEEQEDDSENPSFVENGFDEPSEDEEQDETEDEKDDKDESLNLSKKELKAKLKQEKKEEKLRKKEEKRLEKERKKAEKEVAKSKKRAKDENAYEESYDEVSDNEDEDFFDDGSDE